jgi:Ca2+/H+ antiporter
MLRSTVKFLLLTEAFAVTTYAFGWWAVPLFAFAWAAFVHTRRPVLFATICAASAWAAMLLNDAARGPVSTVGDRFGGILGIPSVALIAITIFFAALLSWSASCVGAAVRKSLFRKVVESEEAAPAEHQRATAGEVVVADA